MVMVTKIPSNLKVKKVNIGLEINLKMRKIQKVG